MTTRTPEQAIDYVRELDDKPPFERNLCKRKTREAFNIASDGSRNATEAWSRTTRRVSLQTGWKAGVFAWWVGGSNGDGHVAFTDDQPGYVWSVDIKRPGRWDRVAVSTISIVWSQLRFVGYSLDIDGVVVEHPAPVFAKTPFIDAAISSTKKAIAERPAGGAVRNQLEAALRDLEIARRKARQ